METDFLFMPTDDNILVDVPDAEEKTGALHITEQSRKRPDYGTVVEVAQNIFKWIKPGSRIAFTKYAGKSIWLNGKEYVVIKQAEVLGIVGHGVDLTEG